MPVFRYRVYRGDPPIPSPMECLGRTDSTFHYSPRNVVDTQLILLQELTDLQRKKHLDGKRMVRLTCLKMAIEWLRN